MFYNNQENIEALVNTLRDEENWTVTWPEIRTMLNDVPEEMAPRLCGLINEFLDKGQSLPAKYSIIICLETVTRKKTQLVPVDLMRRLLAEDSALDYLSVLCIAAMLVSVDPTFIITKGFQRVLMATEMAFNPPQNQSEQAENEYAKKIMYQVWDTVADGDPETLIPFFEYWFGTYGWQKKTTQLLADKILEAAAYHPNIIGDSIDMFKNVLKELAHTDDQKMVMEKYIAGLESEVARIQRKKITEIILGETDLSQFNLSDEILPQQAFSSDPAIDTLMEALLSANIHEEYWAREQLEFKLKSNKPSYAMMQGICEVAYEMFQSNNRDKRYGPLLYTLYIYTEKHPELTPTGLLQEWSYDNRLDNDLLVIIYAMLANTCPGWIVANNLYRSMAEVVAGYHLNSPHILTKIALAYSSITHVSSFPASKFLTRLGLAYPNLIVQFSTKWFELAGFTFEKDDMFVLALTEIARKKPEFFEPIFNLLNTLHQKVLPPVEDDENYFWIELPNSLTTCLDKLKKIKAQ